MRRIFTAVASFVLITIACGVAYAPDFDIGIGPIPDVGGLKLVIGPKDFSSDVSKYSICYDQNSIVDQGTPAEKWVNAYFTGPFPKDVIEHPWKYELFFRNVIDSTFYKWRVSYEAGCIIVGDKFLCQFRAPKALMDTGEFATILGQAKVQIVIAKYSDTKDYDLGNMEMEAVESSKIFATSHSPIFFIQSNCAESCDPGKIKMCPDVFVANLPDSSDADAGSESGTEGSGSPLDESEVTDSQTFSAELPVTAQQPVTGTGTQTSGATEGPGGGFCSLAPAAGTGPGILLLLAATAMAFRRRGR